MAGPHFAIDRMGVEEAVALACLYIGCLPGEYESLDDTAAEADIQGD